MKKGRRRRPDVVLLKDLAPREDVHGGSDKRVFGEAVEASRPPATGTGKKPRSPGKAKS